MGLTKKYPFRLHKPEQSGQAGERALKHTALLLLMMTVIGWICGFVSPLILAPIYIALACCMYMRIRHIRLMSAVVMLTHVAYTLLHCIMDAPLWFSADPMLRLEGIMQKMYSIFYLALVLYLYISPSIAEYYQERRN